MPKSDLTPEQEQWTEKVLKHLQLKNVDEVQPDEIQVERSADKQPNEIARSRARSRRARVLVSKGSAAVHQENVERAAAELQKEISYLSRRYQALATNSKKLDAQARKQLISEEHIELFRVQFEKIGNAFKQFNKNFSGQRHPDAGTLSLLKTLLDKVQYHIVEGKKVLKQGERYADAMIAKEMPAVDAYKDAVEGAFKQRAELVKWGVDTKKFDKAHHIANLPLLRMQKAIADHSYPGLMFVLGKTNGKSEALTKALEDAKGEIEENKTKAQQHLEKTLADAVALHSHVSELEHDPEALAKFAAAFEKIDKATPRGQQALSAGDYQAAIAVLHNNETALFDMQQLWFSNAKSADNGVDEPDMKGKTIPTRRKIENLRNALEQAYDRLPFIKDCLPNAAKYEAECKALKTLLTKAQSDLISGREEEAEEKVLPLRKIRFQLYSLTLKAKQQLEWAEKQLTQLKEEAHSWLDRQEDLKLTSLSDEASKQSYAAYEKEAAIIKGYLQSASDQIENGKAIVAQKNIDEGIQSLKRLAMHVSDIELD